MSTGKDSTTRTIQTFWEVWDYDVWGNAEDGYTVNDRGRIHRGYSMTLTVTVNNPGTPQEFDSAYPTDAQIRDALQIRRGVKLSLDGDDQTIIVERESDGLPIGELLLTYPLGLSPIRWESAETVESIDS